MVFFLCRCPRKAPPERHKTKETLQEATEACMAKNDNRRHRLES